MTLEAQKLKEIILRMAEESVWNGVGRVFVRDLKMSLRDGKDALSLLQVTDDEIMAALKLLEQRYRFWPDENGAILIYFAERKLDLRDYRVNRERILERVKKQR